MGAENGHKIKLLKLIELFRQETDEEHPMLAYGTCSPERQRSGCSSHDSGGDGQGIRLF